MKKRLALKMSPEFEERYRQSYLAADIKQVKMGILLLTIPLVLFFYNDYLFFSLLFEFYFLTALRLGLIAYTVLFFAYLGRLKHSRQYYRSAFAWGLAGVAFQLIVNASRPNTFLFHVIMVIILIFANCLVIPQTFVNRIILSLTLTIGELAIIIMGMPSAAVTALFSVVFSLALANIIGLSISRLMESYRFSTFQAHEEIAELARFPSENPDPVLRVSKDNVILYSNPAANRLFGEQVGVGKPLPNSFHINYGLHGQAEVKYGNQTFLFSTAPMADAGYFNLYALDITELKNAQEKLKDTEERLKEMNKRLEVTNEKLHVVGGLTRHDVRNKLSAVTGNAYLLKRKLAEDPEALEQLTDMETAVRLVGDIFEFATTYEKLGAEQLSYIDVGKTVDEAVSLFPDLKGVKVVNECDGLTVLADSLLRQLFYNLVDNSLKYGEKLSRIRVYYEEKNGGHVDVIYVDDGVGIPQAAKPKLFDEGYTTGKGSGYGLYLVKKMMEVYGWTISETGTHGKGAQFTINIRKAKPDERPNYKLG